MLAHQRSMRSRGTHTFPSVGYPVTEPVRRAIRALPEQVWHPALEQYDSPRTADAALSRVYVLATK